VLAVSRAALHQALLQIRIGSVMAPNRVILSPYRRTSHFGITSLVLQAVAAPRSAGPSRMARFPRAWRPHGQAGIQALAPMRPAVAACLSRATDLAGKRSAVVNSKKRAGGTSPVGSVRTSSVGRRDIAAVRGTEHIGPGTGSALRGAVALMHVEPVKDLARDDRHRPLENVALPRQLVARNCCPLEKTGSRESMSRKPKLLPLGRWHRVLGIGQQPGSQRPENVARKCCVEGTSRTQDFTWQWFAPHGTLRKMLRRHGDLHATRGWAEASARWHSGKNVAQLAAPVLEQSSWKVAAAARQR
jgi:hypothetical protein